MTLEVGSRLLRLLPRPRAWLFSPLHFGLRHWLWTTAFWHPRPAANTTAFPSLAPAPRRQPNTFTLPKPFTYTRGLGTQGVCVWACLAVERANPPHFVSLTKCVWGIPTWVCSANNPPPISKSKWLLSSVAFLIQLDTTTLGVHVCTTFASGVKALFLQRWVWNPLLSESPAPPSPLNPNYKEGFPISHFKCGCGRPGAQRAFHYTTFL